MANPANFQLTQQIGTAITANDTCVAAKMKYIGPAAGDPQVVLGSFDLLFYTDYTTGTVLDDYVFQTGVTAGHVETDKNAADMTWGALAAIVNASDNWRMTLVGARPEDLVYTHSGTVQGFLACAADSTEAVKVDTEDGETIYFDTSATMPASTYQYSICIGPEALDSAFGSFLGRASAANIHPGKNDAFDFSDSAGNDLPGAAACSATDWVAVCNFIEETATFTTSLTIKVYASTQTASRLIHSQAGAATTTTGQYTDAPTHVSRPGERLIIRIEAVGGTLGDTMLLTALKATGGIGVLVP